MTEAFNRPFTERLAKQAKHAVLRGVLQQMRQINPGNAENYETRLLYLEAGNDCAYQLFCGMANAINGAVEHRGDTTEPIHRQRARDWLDALDAYLDRKYPRPAADVAAFGCASTENPGLAPDDPSGQVGAEPDPLEFSRAWARGGKLHNPEGVRVLLETIAELDRHREALKRAGLLKP
jgi:hypothetical protein